MDALRRQRDRYLEEIKEVTAKRRKEPELQAMASQISGLETRLRYSKKDRDTTVSRERERGRDHDSVSYLCVA